MCNVREIDMIPWTRECADLQLLYICRYMGNCELYFETQMQRTGTILVKWQVNTSKQMEQS